MNKISAKFCIKRDTYISIEGVSFFFTLLNNLVGHGNLIGYVLKVIILDEVPFALCFSLFSQNVLFIRKGLKVEIFLVDAFGMHSDWSIEFFDRKKIVRDLPFSSSLALLVVLMDAVWMGIAVLWFWKCTGTFHNYKLTLNLLYEFHNFNNINGQIDLIDLLELTWLFYLKD